MFRIQNQALLSSEEFCSETKNPEQPHNGAGLRPGPVQMRVASGQAAEEGMATSTPNTKFYSSIVLRERSMTNKHLKVTYYSTNHFQFATEQKKKKVS